MSFTLEMFERSLSAPVPLAAADALEWSVNSLKYGLGGPLEASITGYGTIEAIFEMLETLRCPIIIRDEYGRNVWWGMVEEVQVRVDAMEVSASVRYMANKVAVEYNTIVPGTSYLGDRAITDWATDTISISTFGTKEMKVMMSDATTEMAENRRDLMLEERKWPVADWYSSGQAGSLSCTLHLAGWWPTLDWQYWEYLDGYVSYTESGEGIQFLGDVAADEEVAQSFQLSGANAWDAYSIRIRARKEAVPTDNLVVDLCSDSSGSPGTVLATASVAPANVSTDYNWLEFIMSTSVTLVPSTTYWVKVSRAGSLDATNYYIVDVNEELGYSGGSFKIYNGSTWGSRTPDADMLFEVMGVLETTDQIANVLDDAQFLSGYTIDVSGGSGVSNCPYRGGEYTLLSDLLDLLKAGTSNGLRMFAWIDEFRHLHITEEPAKPQFPDYYLTSSATLARRRGDLLPAYAMPVGVWAGIDFIPSSTDTTLLINAKDVFIEWVDYDNETKRANVGLRGIPEFTDTGLKLVEEK